MAWPATLMFDHPIDASFHIVSGLQRLADAYAGDGMRAITLNHARAPKGTFSNTL